MTKQDIIEHLTHNCGLHRSSAIAAVNGVIDAMTTSLKSGNDITIRGFGTLSPVKRGSRNAIHFNSKQPIVIPAHTSVKFKISKELKNTLNNGSN